MNNKSNKNGKIIKFSKVPKKPKNRETLITQYTELLEKSKDDAQIFSRVNRLIGYFKDRYGENSLDRNQASSEILLKEIYHFYLRELEMSRSQIRFTPIEKLPDLQQRLNSDHDYLSLISQLIIDEKNALYRQEEIKKIESLLSEEEVRIIKEKYIRTSEDPSPKL